MSVRADHATAASGSREAQEPLESTTQALSRPEILAPAGDTNCFLAALAAGADAVYLGLKHFSARMDADNFGLAELSRLTALAHEHRARVFVAMNTLLKPGECDQAWRLLRRLASLPADMAVDGLIVQDLAMLDLARQAEFGGGLVLSTLANVTHVAALNKARELGATRVVLPRELSVDEMRRMGEQCPDGLELECFVHGALCYCVSGRCWWSSYMGGKSGLRGRCVQPCRRVYRQGPLDAKSGKILPNKGRQARYFSCLDLSLDVLAKTLLTIPHLTSWKIEGRKKGPHYVYHVVTAYRMLRDNPNDALAKRDALSLVEMALGRSTTHARFLPQKSRVPTDPEGQTSSGLLVGKIVTQEGRPAIKSRMELLPRDYLRIGVEDERFHTTMPVTRRVGKGGTLVLRLPRHTTPPAGTPVFLIDRREAEFVRLLNDWQNRLGTMPQHEVRAVSGAPHLPHALSRTARKRRADMRVLATLPSGKANKAGAANQLGLWLTRRATEISRTVAPRIAWWLPPVLWPEEEHTLGQTIAQLWRNGCRNFVCNAPWQRGLFPEELPSGSNLVAGPFCNTANACALGVLRQMGFATAIVSPELPRDDVLALPGQSPLPLGFVLAGHWPVGISRFGLLGIKPNEPFASPKGEMFWSRVYGENVWLYPAWPLDFSAQRQELLDAGYCFFATLQENLPKTLPPTSRPGLFNWEGSLL